MSIRVSDEKYLMDYTWQYGQAVLETEINSELITVQYLSHDYNGYVIQFFGSKV
jgi:hypothetical protein